MLLLLIKLMNIYLAYVRFQSTNLNTFHILTYFNFYNKSML